MGTSQDPDELRESNRSRDWDEESAKREDEPKWPKTLPPKRPTPQLEPQEGRNPGQQSEESQAVAEEQTTDSQSAKKTGQRPITPQKRLAFSPFSAVNLLDPACESCDLGPQETRPQGGQNRAATE